MLMETTLLKIVVGQPKLFNRPTDAPQKTTSLEHTELADVVELGQTTADGRFTLLPICCLGNCDKGPTLMIDKDTHGPVAVTEISSLLEPYA